ncbi:D-serine ammonia-lyase [Alkalihalobacillus pseudalcaliphilus]|uniref:D-serine ammonia-lyase n=1 Tax=Alkalihalobacillus pseudalcaliphilus TaxID=79884 RepID=UPI00064E0409|nr:D-serine ammonia-lyase [Alkalihalobacillus pseudalcaliphilus]KMK75062.1 serine ammonia-lyase [Alkalihalobacillus pseudalcaliphilus]
MTNNQTLTQLQSQKELIWLNPDYQKSSTQKNHEISVDKIEEARQRLIRFAPYLQEQFPELMKTQGLIESPLTPIPQMKKELQNIFGGKIDGQLFLKEDNQLAIAGSVKGRGGIYEVLKVAEEIALKHELLVNIDQDYRLFGSEQMNNLLSQYTIQVGSTGNLGLSIGMMSAQLGFQVIVHMSADAKAWKKDLLRRKGVTVVEYKDDYSKAVSAGRQESDANPKSHFIDDENSIDLFVGYATAANYLKQQLHSQNIEVNAQTPLFVYIPCGVGGAPGGITFGLKEAFGPHVHCFFVEPTNAPCMLLGMSTNQHDKIAVTDIGLTGQTAADGLAVGRPSSFIGQMMKPLLSGSFTISEKHLFLFLQTLYKSENIFIEPSAAAGFNGLRFHSSDTFQTYLRKHQLTETVAQSNHIVWATGGRLVPQKEREQMLQFSPEPI